MTTDIFLLFPLIERKKKSYQIDKEKEKLQPIEIDIYFSYRFKDEHHLELSLTL